MSDQNLPPSNPIMSGSPTDPRPGMPIFTPDFAADPHHFYREMRRAYGAVAPVELAPGIAASLILTHRCALQVLNDPDSFPTDPRVWEESVAADCPVLPLLRWRPLASKNTGPDFHRYRQAAVAGLARVDLSALHRTVESAATELIDGFIEDGVPS